MLPYFFIMLSETIRELILRTIEAALPEAYVLDLNLRRGKQNVLIIKADTDQGITLDQCADISRKVGYVLETEPEMDFPYVLEVSSPGVGFPLTLHRQYVKNIGRNLKVTRNDLTQVSGVLTAVGEGGIQLSPLADPGKKPKKASEPEETLVSVTFADIREAVVFI
ncbi:MAG: ribosome maturation factor RimP [Bacteroidetes bacterium]|nr:MAG: ribosome maturation factor RimP [Bacteroidota bacterium]